MRDFLRSPLARLWVPVLAPAAGLDDPCLCATPQRSCTVAGAARCRGRATRARSCLLRLVLARGRGARPRRCRARPQRVADTAARESSRAGPGLAALTQRREVRVQDLVAPEQGDDGADREERAERN